MRKFLCLFLFLFLLAICKTNAQDFYNPYPLTSELSDCASHDPLGPNDYTQVLSDYCFDNSRHLLKTIKYEGQLYNSDTFHWKHTDTIEYRYDSSYRYISWKDGGYFYEDKFDSKNRISWFKRQKNGQTVLYGTYQYNAAGQPTAVNFYSASDGAPLIHGDTEDIVYIPYKRLWIYNTSGKQVQLTQQQQDTVSKTWNNVSRYDSFYDGSGRDTAGRQYLWKNNNWVLAYAQRYLYDSNGNRIHEIYYSINAGVWETIIIQDLAYDSSGKITSCLTFTKDADGNISNSGTKNYMYFDDGRLRTINVTSRDEQDRTWTFDEQGHLLFGGNYYIYYSAEYEGGRIKSSYSQYFFGQGGSTYGCGNDYYYDTHPVFVISDLVISQQSKNSFGIFNNPVTDNLNIEVMDSISEPFQLNLYSVTGKMVFYQNTATAPGVMHFEINMQALEKGFYILVVRKGNQVFEQKIVKT